VDIFVPTLHLEPYCPIVDQQIFRYTLGLGPQGSQLPTSPYAKVTVFLVVFAANKFAYILALASAEMDLLIANEILFEHSSIFRP